MKHLEVGSFSRADGTIQQRIDSLKRVFFSVSEGLLGVGNALIETNYTVHFYGSINVLEAKRECELYLMQIMAQLEILKKWVVSGERQQLVQLSVLPSHRVSMVSQIGSFKRNLLNTQVCALSYLERRSGGDLCGLMDFGRALEDKSLEGLRLDENIIFKYISTRIRTMLNVYLPQANVYEVIDGGELKVTISSIFLVDLVFGLDGNIIQVQFNDDLDLPMPQIRQWTFQLLQHKKFNIFFELLKSVYDGRFMLAQRISFLENVCNDEKGSGMIFENEMTDQSQILSSLSRIEGELIRLGVHEINLKFSPVERLYLRSGWLAPSPSGMVSIFYVHPLFLLDIQLEQAFESSGRGGGGTGDRPGFDTKVIDDSVDKREGNHFCVDPPTCNPMYYEIGEFSLDSASVGVIEQLRKRGFYDWLNPIPSSQPEPRCSLDLYCVYSARIKIGVGPIHSNGNCLQGSFIEKLLCNVEAKGNEFEEGPESLDFYGDGRRWEPHSVVAWKDFQHPKDCKSQLNLNFILELSKLIPISFNNLRLLQTIPGVCLSDLECMKKLEDDGLKHFSFLEESGGYASLRDLILHMSGDRLRNERFVCNGIGFKFLISNNFNLKYLMVESIPFTHLAQFQPMLRVLRRQIVWNNLYQSCFFFAKESGSNKRPHSEVERGACGKSELRGGEDGGSDIVEGRYFVVEISELDYPYFGCQVIFKALAGDMLINFLINVRISGFIDIKFNSDKKFVDYDELRRLLNRTHDLPVSLSTWFRKVKVFF